MSPTRRAEASAPRASGPRPAPLPALPSSPSVGIPQPSTSAVVARPSRRAARHDLFMCDSAGAIATYAELRGSGIPRRSLENRVRDGRLILVRRGVYATPEICGPLLECARHGGAAACTTAAAHLGLFVLESDPAPHVWLKSHAHARAHRDCRCVPHWDDGSRSSAFSLPSVERVLRQILGCRGLEAFFVTLESALRLGLLQPAQLAWLRAATNDEARAAIAFARADADSGIESLLRWRLRERGLEIRSQVHIFAVGVVDFVIGERLIIEVDGRANHEGESLRHKDLVRDANAAAWGYVTLRFDYAMIVHDWETVELAILAHLDRRRHLA